MYLNILPNISQMLVVLLVLVMVCFKNHQKGKTGL